MTAAVKKEKKVCRGVKGWNAVMSAWRPDRLKQQVPSFVVQKQVRKRRTLPDVDETGATKLVKFLANIARRHTTTAGQGSALSSALVG